MQELVDALLLLARLDEHAPQRRTSVDLDDLALAEVSRLRAGGSGESEPLTVDGSASPLRASPATRRCWPGSCATSPTTPHATPARESASAPR
ncbi:hypothetical protein [Microbacterium thalli]|uniref:Uncharacterized protein n=1 Tax=Microbacterium thalli TaxID=3027921 RepID=A0ABT5SDA7_9MICO|nr:hypothetical protein [Microbacterium thalli]MDD7960773.1 hypothetical protein [Microbacterium thalli]